jgi:hypothetical protein
MTTIRSRWLTATAVALAVLITGTATVFGVTSTLSAKGNMLVRIAREDTTTGSVTANSTNYVDIPGASLTVNAPARTNGSVLIARFQGHVSIIQATGCVVRLIVNDTTVMEPNGNYPFAGQGDVSQSVATSGEIERSLKVFQGTYTVKAQLRLTQAANTNSLCIMGAWHFILERMNS